MYIAKLLIFIAFLIVLFVMLGRAKENNYMEIHTVFKFAFAIHLYLPDLVSDNFPQLFFNSFS